LKLSTGGPYWAQYSYQFSHEFCHILCNYRKGKLPNRWFEEAVCEMASLYSLRQMGETWKTTPPYPQWNDFAPKLTAYAQELMDETDRPTDMASWFKTHQDRLYVKEDLRDLNRVVAVMMLPMFEADPSHWRAVASLNAMHDRGELSFEDFLRAWHEMRGVSMVR